MDYEPVGNSSQVSGTGAEVADLDQEFAEMAGFFDLDAEDDGAGLDELEAALVGSGLEDGGSESGALTLLDFADGNFGAESMPEFWNPIKNWIEKKAKRLVKKVVAKVRKYSKYRSCLPTVLKAIAAIKAGKWGSAIKHAYAAYRCMKSK